MVSWLPPDSGVNIFSVLPLENEGFVTSKYDSCRLIKPNMLIVLYVNDAGVCTKNKHDIDELICRLMWL